MGTDKDRWTELIGYLNKTPAKPESVLNLVKNTWKPKSNKPIVKTDPHNIIRRAWALMVVSGIYNKHGVPKKPKRKITITNQILYFCEADSYKINYNLFHPIKTKAKDGVMEWNENREDTFSKKTLLQHAKNCRKLWDSPKGKILRKEMIKTKGKIPVTHSPLFEV